MKTTPKRTTTHLTLLALLWLTTLIIALQAGITHGRAIERATEANLESPEGSDLALCRLHNDCDEDFMAVGESHDQR